MLRDVAPTRKPGRSRPGVYQRRGKWFYVIDVKDPGTGQWRKVWSHAYERQAEAYAGRLDALGRVQRQEFAAPGRMTVGEYLDRWEKGRPVGFGLRETTANAYHYQIQWALPHIGRIQLRELQPDQLRAMYRRLLDHGGRGGRPLSASSVKGVHTALHKAFEDAVDDGLLYRNPVDRVKRPTPIRTRELAVWELGDAVAFLAAVQEDRLFAMWMLFLSTGMRRGEVAGLRWKDVNLGTGQVAVRHQLTCINGRVITGDPKTTSSTGTVAIDDRVVEALRRHRIAQQEERLAMGPAWANTGYVFVWPDGRPYNPQYLTGLFQRLVGDAGLPTIRLHDLRHTCATLLKLGTVAFDASFDVLEYRANTGDLALDVAA